MSGFIPRHIEQPAERQSKPARAEDLVEALPLGLRLDLLGARHHHRVHGRATLRPLTTSAASRRSPMRELVHEPMKTRSSLISWMGVPGSSAM